MIYLPNLMQTIRQKPLYNQNKASIKNSKSVFFNKTTHFSTLQHLLSMLGRDPICMFYNEYWQMLYIAENVRDLFIAYFFLFFCSLLWGVGS